MRKVSSIPFSLRVVLFLVILAFVLVFLGNSLRTFFNHQKEAYSNPNKCHSVRDRATCEKTTYTSWKNTCKWSQRQKRCFS